MTIEILLVEVLDPMMTLLPHYPSSHVPREALGVDNRSLLDVGDVSDKFSQFEIIVVMVVCG